MYNVLPELTESQCDWNRVTEQGVCDKTGVTHHMHIIIMMGVSFWKTKQYSMVQWGTTAGIL